MAEATILIVNQDRKDALRLAVESLRRHNTDVKFLLWIWDNNSTDGSQEWARDNCDRLFVKDSLMGCHHGIPLDRMCQLVETPFTVTLDNDVRTKAPFLRRLIDEIRDVAAFAAGPKARMSMGTVMGPRVLMHGQPRIDPCCAVFDTHQIARMTRSVSFTSFECEKLARFYDTGSMIRQAAEGAGLRVLDLDWLWDSIEHYGAMTWAGYAAEGTNERRLHTIRIEKLRNDLAEQDEAMLVDSEVVVARYKENLDWLADCPHKAAVYDKSDEPSGLIKLPNVGREPHTFVHHVAENYDRLPEVTWFVQGSPFDHVPDLMQQFRTPTSSFRLLSPHRFTTGPDGDPSHSGLPNAKTYQMVTGRPWPDGDVVFGPGGCFVAHRSVLRRYPAEWWKRLAAFLNTGDVETQLPWTMERLWKLLLAGSPIPHRYHEIMGWFTDHKFYREMVEQAPDAAHFVEVGCWHGRSTRYLATEIANSGKQIRLDAVDHFRGSQGEGEQFMRDEAASGGGTIRATFDANMGPLLSRINVVQEASTKAAELYKDESLDFVFIDAGHSEEEVLADIVAWHPKVKPGGILSGHDFSGAWPGVERAVRRAIGDDFEFVPPMSWKHRKAIPPA